ncbi:hypothetical protein FALCPG4_005713 [Fusarium falciforme]
MKGSSKERVKNLESRVGQIYDMLQSLTDRNDDATAEPILPSLSEQRLSSTSDSYIISNPSNSSVSPPFDADVWSPSNPEPPAQVLDYLVNVYKTKIYFQPLPLLALADLPTRVPRFPRYLRWSFLSLCLRHSESYFYHEREAQAVEFYTASSQELTMTLAAEGVATAEVIQSLCLLALGDIMVNKQTRAWMSIGAAARLVSLQMLSRQSTSRTSDDEETYSRCYWSVFTLEKAYSPAIMVLDRLDNPPPLPPSPPLPAPAADPDTEGGIITSDNSDPGIIAPSIQIISIWGDITTYLGEIRLGKTEIPWSSNSTYSRLMVRLQEFELDLSPPHRFENILVKRRTPAELLSYREYWTPWTIMQLSSHAALAVLHHPFIHLVALRDRSRKTQPKIFLQQVVDQALFHTGWVIRLLQTFEQMELEVNDPVMGHQVAATAIIPWLFQFAQDHHIAEKAREGLYLCERFLERLSLRWPHIRYKLRVLRDLHSAAENGLDSSMVTFNTASFWKILDSPPPDNISGDPCNSADASTSSNNDPNATLRVTTKFVQPWVDEHSGQKMSQVDPPFFSPGAGSDSMGQVSLDDFFSQFAINEALWTQPGVGNSGLI